MDDIQDQDSENTEITFTNTSLLTGSILINTVQKMARDMRFFAIFYLIYGALMCLTIIGAIIGIPMIIYHLKLKDAADQYEDFLQRKDFFSMQKAFENQRKFFFFHKILIILGILFFVTYILFFIFIGTSMMMPDSSEFV